MKDINIKILIDKNEFKKKLDIKDGKDYILTKKDKAEIASQIDVPIVEKTVVEQPIVKEVAKTESAEKIVDKLNTLDEKLDPKVIKGISDMFKNLQNSIRENKPKGGGMGNWVHERFNISSATTSITLAYNIAAGGMAHIARYQGQVQDLDTDYSVNGKIITLLFTPQDNTVFSVAYVRT